MLKRTTLAPTRRECFLVALLLFALLSMSRTSIGLWESRAQENIVQKDDSNTKFASQDDRVPTMNLDRWRTQVTWTTGRAPLTTVVTHVPGAWLHFQPNLLLTFAFKGWTVFDNLFLLNGTVFVVSDDPESVPDRNTITSTGLKIENGAEAVAARLPTDREFRVITINQAQQLFGMNANLVDGTTVRRSSCKCTSSNTRLSGS